MKLTTNDKSAFVRAVMDDVPQVDYDEFAGKLVKEWVKGVMPEEVNVALKKHPDWFSVKHAYMPNGLRSIYACISDKHSCYGLKENAPDLWRELEILGNEAFAQRERRKDLECRVKAMIAGCSTLKQAKERLPEFEKYLPTNRDGTGVINLPTVVDTVTELTKAGWPKAA